MKKYLKIARIDHWIKQLFILPGVVLALLITGTAFTDLSIYNLIAGFLGTSFIASANYVINEWLDAPYDKYHPTKKYRPVVTENMSFKWVMVEYFIFAIVGLLISYSVNKLFFIVAAVLLIMGFFYNVKPFRTKDIPFVDVLSESVNNMLRLMMGWFIVSGNSIPPSSVLLGYWMAGAFLMATKRFAEYRMIGDKSTAGLYRRSFRFYTEKSLLASALFYALISTFALGVFMIKYRIEYLVATPVMFLLFAYYLAMSLDNDSAVQKPEKLYKEKKLMILVLIFVIVVLFCTVVDMNFLQELTSNALITIEV
ncbi:MAG: UbiA prenyltransferase family protein [Butyrivibrio sp.]|nr:UbiA prenyltransferase family protein [Butyrivibrio sp.]